jgi:hypothetical protein
MGVQVPLLYADSHSFRYMPTSDRAGCYYSSVFTFFRNLHTHCLFLEYGQSKHKLDVKFNKNCLHSWLLGRCLTLLTQNHQPWLQWQMSPLCPCLHWSSVTLLAEHACVPRGIEDTLNRRIFGHLPVVFNWSSVITNLGKSGLAVTTWDLCLVHLKIRSMSLLATSRCKLLGGSRQRQLCVRGQLPARSSGRALGAQFTEVMSLCSCVPRRAGSTLVLVVTQVIQKRLLAAFFFFLNNLWLQKS